MILGTGIIGNGSLALINIRVSIEMRRPRAGGPLR